MTRSIARTVFFISGLLAFFEDLAIAEDIFEVPLDQILDIDITSVSKKSEKLSKAAAAVFVITAEDIRRSTATNIPELLRTVPGLDVAQIDGSQWAISSRGFNGVFADKLLVLIDGRTIYRPLTSGVFWADENPPLETIERIEVIRGPGATLWGANAVNGVINIITKDASRSDGTYISTGGGNQLSNQTVVRQGGTFGSTAYRLYGNGFSKENNQDRGGQAAYDHARYDLQSGIRTDSALSAIDTLTVSGDVFTQKYQARYIAPRPDLPTLGEFEDTRRYTVGGNITTKWNRRFDDTSDMTVQAYYFGDDHRYENALNWQNHTYDLDFQYRLSPFQDHDFVWGANYRFYEESADSSFPVALSPESRAVDNYTAFLQDEVSLLPNKLSLILGVKLEENKWVGSSAQPNARVIYTPEEGTNIWAAISRAIRNPARFNNDGLLRIQAFPTQTGLPGLLTLSGNENFNEEEMIAYEAGIRRQFSDQVTVDLASFFNSYNHLESAEPKAPPTPSMYNGVPYLEIPMQVENRLSGESAGAEVVIDYRPYEWWRLVSTYTYFTLNLAREDDSVDQIFMGAEHSSPANQAMLRSHFDLPANFELDATLRYVDTVATYKISGYEELDMRLGWRASKSLEFSLYGTSLLDSAHPEFQSNFVSAPVVEIRRSVFGQITWNFS